MTIIAYRDGILAADSAATVNDTKLYGRLKVFRRDDGVLYGSAGDCAEGETFRQWVGDGEKGKFKITAKTDGILVRPGGQVWLFTKNGPYSLNPDYYAWGSGMDFALGAMHAGADVFEAVEAAIKHSTNCGGEVNWVWHQDRPLIRAARAA